jgi:hypothetical protein
VASSQSRRCTAVPSVSAIAKPQVPLLHSKPKHRCAPACFVCLLCAVANCIASNRAHRLAVSEHLHRAGSINIGYPHREHRPSFVILGHQRALDLLSLLLVYSSRPHLLNAIAPCSFLTVWIYLPYFVYRTCETFNLAIATFLVNCS